MYRGVEPVGEIRTLRVLGCEGGRVAGEDPGCGRDGLVEGSGRRGAEDVGESLRRRGAGPIRYGALTKGAMPIQCAPSLPMAVRPMVEPTRWGSISSDMPWHPVPAPTSVPSGTLVPQLWGQPEQKKGVRLTDSGIGRR